MCFQILTIYSKSVGPGQGHQWFMNNILSMVIDDIEFRF